MGKNGQDDTGTMREFVARRGATDLRRAGKAVETVIPDLERVIPGGDRVESCWEDGVYYLSGCQPEKLEKHGGIGRRP